MYKIFKRTFDFLSSLLLFIAISPIFLVLVLLVKSKLGSPVFFKQVRTGRGGKQFSIMKFRTMTNETDEKGNLLPNEKRITKLGRFLRSSSLDELPELLNIIKGDMSVIGPRPLPPVYDEYYTEYEKDRFLVRGGLIPPEVLYNNVQPTWEEQFTYEVEYARNLSFSLDMRVMFAVFKGIFTRYEKDYGAYSRKPLSEERKKVEVAEKK